MTCKLLVIGHDGLDLELLRKFRDRLPVVSRLAEDGQLLRMRSVYRSTVPSWMSIYTGLRQEQHGCGVGWESWVKSQRFKAAGKSFFWDKLNGRGYTTGILGMPLTYPPRKVDGWMVSGFPTPLGKTCGLAYPPEIDELLGEYVVDIVQVVDEHMEGEFTEPQAIVTSHCDKFRRLGPEKVMRKTIDGKISTLRKILEAHPVEVVSVGFCFVDHNTHLHGNVEEAYSLVDYSLNETIKAANPDKTVIVSDHGHNHTENGVLLVKGARVEEKDYSEWEVADIILGMLSEREER